MDFITDEAIQRLEKMSSAGTFVRLRFADDSCCDAVILSLHRSASATSFALERPWAPVLTVRPFNTLQSVEISLDSWHICGDAIHLIFVLAIFRLNVWAELRVAQQDEVLRAERKRIGDLLRPLDWQTMADAAETSTPEPESQV